MKVILKNGTEIKIAKMFENYYEKANAEEDKRTITLNTEGETIDTLKEKLTAENLSSVSFVTGTATDARTNLQLIMISKTTSEEESTVSVRLAA